MSINVQLWFFFASCKAVCKALSLNFYNDNTFFFRTWCDINPPLVFFLKKEQAIHRRGKSQGTIGLIVLLNRSIITIRPRLPTGTKYSQGVSRKERLKEQNPKENGIKPLTSLLTVFNLFKSSFGYFCLPLK